MRLLPILCFLLMPACSAQTRYTAPQTFGRTIVQPRAATLEARFAPPEGYRRIPLPAGSYGAFLRTQPLYPDGTPVRLYDGREKPNPNVYAAVLTLDRGTEDLQQCADAVMRLRAEWLYGTGRKDDIRFTLTSGLVADFIHWSMGYRIIATGNKASWVKKAGPDASYASFRKYLDAVYTYAGTRSLAKELHAVPVSDMQPGDVFIVGGSPGHAITVMDIAVNSAGRKVYLLSQSYMPAQDIQILCNPANAALSPWYELPQTEGPLLTPEWDFTTADLKRF